MPKKQLYHGSPVIVEHPKLEMGRTTNDFGRGFYCTEHKALAMEWACTSERGGFSNSYLLETGGLEILDLKSLEQPTLRWLAILLEHRASRLGSPIMRRAREWLLDNYRVDLAPYDLIIGYRADDSYFGFTRAFLNGVITLEQLSAAMQLGNLGEQYVLRSERAFEALEFVEAEPVEQATFYLRRTERDRRARKHFNGIPEERDRGGITIRSLVDGEIGVHDERLR